MENLLNSIWKVFTLITSGLFDLKPPWWCKEGKLQEMCHCPKPFISVSSLHTIFSPYLSGFFSSPAKFIPAFLSRRAINGLILYNALHSVWTVTETQIITITPVPSLKPLSIWGQTLQLWLIGAMACSIPPDHCCNSVFADF